MAGSGDGRVQAKQAKGRPSPYAMLANVHSRAGPEGAAAGYGGQKPPLFKGFPLAVRHLGLRPGCMQSAEGAVINPLEGGHCQYMPCQIAG